MDMNKLEMVLDRATAEYEQSMLNPYTGKHRARGALAILLRKVAIRQPKVRHSAVSA